MQLSTAASMLCAGRDGHAAALAGFDGDEASFGARVAAAVREGTIAERIAIYRGLWLYPNPRAFLAIAGEAVRSAPRPVFEAIAHDNPYPASHFGDDLWNEMILRALRLGCRLAPIEGLDDRRNEALAHRLIAYVRERRAVHRSINPEVWRCIGPFAAEEHFDELLVALRTAAAKGRVAAAIALAECPSPEALTALESVPMLWHEIRHGRLWWDRVA